MSRRQVLAIAMTLVLLAGAFFVIHIFTRSLSPGGNAKALATSQESGIIDIQDLKIGAETESVYINSPIIIMRLEDNGYRVLSLIPRFSNKNIVGCSIKRLYENSMYRENYPSNTYFIEPCRGVNYDKEGNVLEWSQSSALPMQRLQWKYVANSQSKIEIYP